MFWNPKRTVWYVQIHTGKEWITVEPLTFIKPVTKGEATQRSKAMLMGDYGKNWRLVA